MGHVVVMILVSVAYLSSLNKICNHDDGSDTLLYNHTPKVSDGRLVRVLRSLCCDVLQ